MILERNLNRIKKVIPKQLSSLHMPILDGPYLWVFVLQSSSEDSTVRGKLRQRTVSLYRSMYYGLFSPGTI